MILPSLPFSRNRGRRLPSLAVFGLFVVLCGCTSAESEQKSDTSSNSSATQTAPPSVVMHPHDGDHVWVFAETKDTLGSGGEFQIYVDPVKFPQALASFAKFGLGVGGALPVHRHDKSEEIVYFLTGEGTLTVYDGDQPKDVPVGPGDVAYTPPGSWHAIINTGDEPLTLVFATIPNDKKGLLSFFRRIGAKPGEAAIPLSPEDFARIAAEHDLILRAPDTEQ